MSRSLHSAIVAFGGSKRWSRNERLILPWKSSIGEISSKISSRPDCLGTSPRPDFSASSKRERHKSLPSNQSTLSSCSERRFGTSRGSRIFANETRAGACDFDFAAKVPPDAWVLRAGLLKGRGRYMPNLEGCTGSKRSKGQGSESCAFLSNW